MGNEMKPIDGTVTVELKFDEISYINKLIRRDIPKLAISTELENKYKCPVCRSWAHYTALFCAQCGQRLDPENVAL